MILTLKIDENTWGISRCHVNWRTFYPFSYIYYPSADWSSLLTCPRLIIPYIFSAVPSDPIQWTGPPYGWGGGQLLARYILLLSISSYILPAYLTASWNRTQHFRSPPSHLKYPDLSFWVYLRSAALRRYHWWWAWGMNNPRHVGHLCSFFHFYKIPSVPTR